MSQKTSSFRAGVQWVRALVALPEEQVQGTEPRKGSYMLSRPSSTEPHLSLGVRISCKDLKCQLVSPVSPLGHSCLSDSVSQDLDLIHQANTRKYVPFNSPAKGH